jgi:hypothetical protein
MNHNCILESELVESLKSEDDLVDIKSILPTKYKNIKSKEIVQFVIENNEDLIACLDFLRYCMAKKIPPEIFNYIKDNQSDELVDIIHTQFKDFFNVELSDFLIENNSEFNKLFPRGGYSVSESLNGLVIPYCNIDMLVFRNSRIPDYEVLEDLHEDNNIWDKITKQVDIILREKYPEMYNKETNKIIDDMLEKYYELSEIESEKLWEIKEKKALQLHHKSTFYDDVEISYDDLDSRNGDIIPYNFMSNEKVAPRGRWFKTMYQFKHFAIKGFDLRGVCCTDSCVIQSDGSDFELFKLYKKLIKQKRITVDDDTYIGWLSKTCHCT